MIRRALYIIATILLIMPQVNAQTTIDYSAQISGVTATGNHSPFWFTAIKHGVSSIDKEWGYLRAGIAGKTLLKKEWKLNYGADIIGGRNMTSDIYIQQAYADISWRWLQLSIGKKERVGEFKNFELSTGSLIESGNAAPTPQIRLEVPEYQDIFGTNGWFGVRGHIAYGWFDDGNWQEDWAAKGTRYAKNVLYHSKAIFWKVGKEKSFPLTYEGGAQFASQFGGTIYNYMDNNGKNYDIPNRLKDFWDVFFFSSGDSKYSIYDQLNVAGNHMGSYHLSLKWSDKNWSLRGYYEHMFDDHSGMFWEYGLWKDCLTGAELQLKNFKWLNNVVFEYFNSRDQAGPIYHDTTAEIPDQISAADHYYWHHTYPSWQQYGMILGSPLATSCIYNKSKRFDILNNRVEAFHIGIAGEPLSEFSYRILLTKSHNWGTYIKPFTEVKGNISSLIELTYLPKWGKGFCFNAAFAVDDGELYGNNRGFLFGIKKCGKLF